MGLKFWLYLIIGILICLILCISCKNKNSQPLVVKSIELIKPRDVTEESSPIWKIKFENGDSCWRRTSQTIGDTIWVTKN